MKLALRLFHALAAIGMFVTAIRVLPTIWELRPLDALVVGTALAYFVVRLIGQAAFPEATNA